MHAFLVRRLLAATTLTAAATLAAAAGATAPAEPAAGGATLAVCADPGDLPYSSIKLDGFENKIADVLAADLHRTLRYTWAPQRRNFFARTLLAGACDVVISVPASLPASLPAIATTRPWFTSTYVAVTRTADGHRFSSFDDAWLKSARIGLQLIEGGDVNPPPAMALARRGLTNSITGFSPWDSAEDAPQEKIIDAVANNTVDVALVWGPFGGYFAKRFGNALTIDPIAEDPASPGLAFTFPMAAAVRSTDTALKDALQGAFDRNRVKIAAILKDFNIPLVGPSPEAAAPGAQFSTLTH
jgi:quinoprotein dehydrogenase-associated probable ABC transporter substrate-binding protein